MVKGQSTHRMPKSTLCSWLEWWLALLPFLYKIFTCFLKKSDFILIFGILRDDGLFWLGWY